MLITILVVIYFIISLLYNHVAMPVGGFLQRTVTVFFCGPTLVFAAVQDDHLMIIGILIFTFVIFWMFGRDLGLFTELIEECLYVAVMIYFFRLGLLGGKLRLFWVADCLLAIGALFYLIWYAKKCRDIEAEYVRENGARLTRAQKKEKKKRDRIQAAIDAHEAEKQRASQAAKGPNSDVTDFLDDLNSLTDVNGHK